MTRWQQLIFSSRHEAGHAVYWHLIGGKVRFCTVRNPEYDEQLECWKRYCCETGTVNMKLVPFRAYTSYRDADHVYDRETGVRRPATQRELAARAAAGVCAERLMKWKPLTGRAFLFTGGYKADGDAVSVFESYDGTARDTWTKTEQLRAALEDAATVLLPQFRQLWRVALFLEEHHHLRHENLCHLSHEIEDISTVAAIAGHASVNTTARYDLRGDEAKHKAQARRARKARRDVE